MKKSILVSLALLCGAGLFLQAEEEKTPVFTIRSVKDNPEYQKGETAEFIMDFRDADGNPMPGYTVKYQTMVEGGGGEDHTAVTGEKPVILRIKQDVPGSCSLAGGPFRQDGTPFLNKGKRPLRDGSGAAFSLNELQQGYPEPADFDAFWTEKKKDLAAVPMKAEYKEIDIQQWNSGRNRYFADKVHAYDVKITCCGAKPVTGYFVLPQNAQPKSLPAIVIYNAYGVGSAAMPFGYGTKALAFDVNANGLENGREPDYYSKLADGPLCNYFYIGNTDRETIYFKDMYLRALRALEFVKSRPEWNGKDLIVFGYSQGGAQALAVSGLDSDITLCVVCCPALCDLGGICAGRRSGWIVPYAKVKQVDGKCASPEGDKILKATSYIDNANFARRIRAETFVSSGACDCTCPMASVYAAYQNISAKKHFCILPNEGHVALNPEGIAAIQKILNGTRP